MKAPKIKHSGIMPKHFFFFFFFKYFILPSTMLPGFVYCLIHYFIVYVEGDWSPFNIFALNYGKVKTLSLIWFYSNRSGNVCTDTI